MAIQPNASDIFLFMHGGGGGGGSGGGDVGCMAGFAYPKGFPFNSIFVRLGGASRISFLRASRREEDNKVMSIQCVRTNLSLIYGGRDGRERYVGYHSKPSTIISENRGSDNKTMRVYWAYQRNNFQVGINA
jgi:hypothetical protein